MDVYHGVPSGWSRAAIIQLHDQLEAPHPLEVPEAIEPGAPSFLPGRYNWLQYRAALYEIIDGIKISCPACIEIGIRYIELNYMGSYSGFVREGIARALKRQHLGKDHRERLLKHFSVLASRKIYLKEYAEYIKLAKAIENMDPGK